MFKDSSAMYYQKKTKKSRNRFKKVSRKVSKSFGRKKNENILMKDTRTFQKMNNKKT